MNRIVFGTAIILIVAFAAFGQKAAVGKVDPTKGVHEAFDRLIDGIKQVDVDKVMDSYEKSDRLLIFNNNGSATIGATSGRIGTRNRAGALDPPHHMYIRVELATNAITVVSRTSANSRRSVCRNIIQQPRGARRYTGEYISSPNF